MKLIHSGFLIVLMVIVVLAVSGCSGGSSTTNPTPTAQPGASTGPTGSGTPAPTQSTGTPSSLFNLGSLHMYEYKLTSVSGGQTTEMTYKIEYSDSTYQGTAAKLTKMTYNMPQSGQMIVSLYYDKGDDHLLGGTYTMMTGATTMEFPIPADQGSSYSENDWATSSRDTFEDTTGWTNVGSETLTANGKSYTCTKYTWSMTGYTYSVCTNNQAPMPMKYAWTDDKGDSWTMQLLNWN